jgi:hypothetical protein
VRYAFSPARRLSAIWPASLGLKPLDDSGAPGPPWSVRDLAVLGSRTTRLAVCTLNGCPAVIAAIGGRDGILRRLFVRSKEGALRPSIDFVEFFGEDLAGGDPLYEKFVPVK